MIKVEVAAWSDMGRERELNEDRVFYQLLATSDTDPGALCIVADGAERQIETAVALRRSLRHIRPKPPFTLVPITPVRLLEKQQCSDPFFATILAEGLLLATQN